ncbi:MAG TPA: hypothetical protein VGC39_05440, partial [Candidatus Methylacidiphilales bacterium]
MNPTFILFSHMIRTLRCFAAVLLLGPAFLIDCRADAAQPPSPDPWNAVLLTVAPDHTNGIYALNEPAVWTVDV